MDIPQYASLFAPDTLATLRDIFTSQPDVVDLALAGTPYIDTIRTLLTRSETTCYADNGGVTGMRMRSYMGAVAFMLEPFRSMILTHIGGVLSIEQYTLLIGILPIVSSVAPALDHFLGENGFGLARTAFRALGYDVWSFLAAGFSPDTEEVLFYGDLEDVDTVSADIVDAWTEFLHTL